jgi:hypothetical protein
MNFPELLCLLLLSNILFIYLWRSSRQVRNAAFITIAIVPALYLSIETTSQFLTVDEIYIIRETADLDFHYINQWYAGANRTTDTFLGAFSRIIRAMFSPRDTHLKMVLKLAHFSAGFLVLLLIHFLGSRWIPARMRSGTWSIIFFYITLLLPVSAVAFKIFNYDLLSMTLGVLALFLIAAAFCEKRSLYALLAVVSSYLAAQDKVSASPILLFCCALYGVFYAENKSGLPAAKILMYDLRGIMIALATGCCCVIIVALAGTGDFPRSFVARTLDPFTNPLWPIMRFTFGFDSHTEFSYFRYLKMLSLVSALIYMFSMVLNLFQSAVRKFPGRLLLPAMIRRANYLFAATVLIAGILSTFFVHMHFGVFSSGMTYPFIHTSPFNNNITWFGATNNVQHILMSVGYAYAVFVNALPSVIWLMIVLVIFIECRKPVSTGTPWYAEAVLAGIFLVPLAWGISQFPVCNRYLNIFLFLMVLIVCIKFINALAQLPKKATIPAITIALFFLVMETLPFRPVYTAFRPIWSSFPDKDIPEPTLGNPSWVGWGEDVMIAGKKVEQLIRDHSTRLGKNSAAQTLYTLYAGDYLTMSGNLPFAIKYVLKDSSFYRYDVERLMSRSGKTCVKSQVVYDSCALFLVSRYNFIIDGIPFPRTAAPLFTISYRGYPQAWVWRGDALKKAGVAF